MIRTRIQSSRNACTISGATGLLNAAGVAPKLCTNPGLIRSESTDARAFELDEEDMRGFHGLEFDFGVAQQYCQKLAPYFRAINWRSSRVGNRKVGNHPPNLRANGFHARKRRKASLELYRRMKSLYGTRSNLVHAIVANKKGLITYDKLRLDAKWTIVSDQDYFDLFDICRRLFQAVLAKPDLGSLLEKKNSTLELNEYYLHMVFSG